MVVLCGAQILWVLRKEKQLIRKPRSSKRSICERIARCKMCLVGEEGVTVGGWSRCHRPPSFCSQRPGLGPPSPLKAGSAGQTMGRFSLQPHGSSHGSFLGLVIPPQSAK
jgi:hypothetical protein